MSVPVIDPFGRNHLSARLRHRRCDFRCVYCMAEDMTFLPRSEVLSLEELDRLCSAFVRLGVRKLRLTGGEPLVRRNIMSLFRSLGRHLPDRRARRADAHHQRQPARPLCGRAKGRGGAADQRLARYARSREVRRDHALGQARQGAGGHRRRRSAPGSTIKLNVGRAQGRKRR